MIIRARHEWKTAPYAIISRQLLQENQLPYGPKCLLLLMLSYPDTWNFSVDYLADIMAEPAATIRTWLNVLSHFGYFHEYVDVVLGESRMSVDWLVTENPVGEKKNEQ